MKRQDIKALRNTIYKSLGAERGYKDMGFAFYFDAMTACEMLSKLLDTHACFTCNEYLAEWFKDKGFNVRVLKGGYYKRYVIS